MAHHPAGPRGRLAAAAVRLASTWVAAGALFKLLSGSPNDLPPLVQRIGFDPVTNFRLAIAIELCIVITCLLRPRLGWLPLALLFVVFDLLLAPLVAQGAESCGCFGSRVPITPVVMMTIDTALLLAVLASRPWSALAGRRWSPLPLLPLFALAAVAPWYFFRTGGSPSSERRTAAVAGGSVAAPTGGSTEVAPPQLPDFHQLHTDRWSGREILQIEELWGFLDTVPLPPDCLVVFYRQQCEHCAEHLEELAMQPASPDELLVLARVPDPDDAPENEATRIKPEAVLEVEFVALERGYGGLHTPGEMPLREGIVQEYRKIEHD